jgi:hypothetical protein
MNPKDLEYLARLIRDAYIDVYIKYRPDFSEEEWERVNVKEGGVYKRMAEYLMKRGVKVPLPTEDPKPSQRKKLSVKHEKGWFDEDQG